MPYAYDLSHDFDSDRYVSWALTDAGEGVFAPLIDSNPGGYHLIGHGEIGSADDYLVVPISLYSGQSLVLDIITGFGGFDPAAVEIAVVDALGNSVQEFDWTGSTTSSAFSAPSSGLYYVVVHDQSGDYISNFNVFPGNGETGELLLDLSTQPIEFLDRRVGTQDDDTEDARGLPFNVNFDGRGGNDTFFAPNSLSWADGGDGDDRLVGGTAIDQFFGGEGRDRLEGNGGDDVLVGGSGDDVLIGGDGQNQLLGGSGDDLLAGGSGNETLLGERGHDVIKAGEGADTIRGGEDNDNIFGWRGADSIRGDAGDDTIRGDFDDDILEGGPGSDRIQGGPGRDSFVFRLGFGEDRILDYNTFLEKLDFRPHFNIAGIEDLTISQVGSSTVILDGFGGRIVLADVAATSISESDFEFFILI